MPGLFAVRMLVEIKEFMDGGRIVILDDVNLLFLSADVIHGPEMSRRRVFLVFDNAFNALLRAMSFKFAPEHLNIGPVTVERITPAMHGHKRASITHPGNKPIAVGQRKVTGGIGKYN